MEASATAQASGLAMNVGPCISAPPSRPVATSARAQRRRERQVAAGERLAEAQDVGGDARVLAGEQRAGAAEAGGDLVGDEQHAVRVAQLAQEAQERRVVEAHAARALDDRLDDDRRRARRAWRSRSARRCSA